MKIKDITVIEFDNVIKKGKILVAFYAPWCGYCKMFMPILEEYANDTNDINIYKVNIDSAPFLAERYNIDTIPTLILFDNGVIKKQDVIFERSKLKEFVNI